MLSKKTTKRVTQRTLCFRNIKNDNHAFSRRTLPRLLHLMMQHPLLPFLRQCKVKLLTFFLYCNHFALFQCPKSAPCFSLSMISFLCFVVFGMQNTIKIMRVQCGDEEISISVCHRDQKTLGGWKNFFFHILYCFVDNIYKAIKD